MLKQFTFVLLSSFALMSSAQAITFNLCGFSLSVSRIKRSVPAQAPTDSAPPVAPKIPSSRHRLRFRNKNEWMAVYPDTQTYFSKKDGHEIGYISNQSGFGFYDLTTMEDLTSGESHEEFIGLGAIKVQGRDAYSNLFYFVYENRLYSAERNNVGTIDLVSNDDLLQAFGTSQFKRQPEFFAFRMETRTDFFDQVPSSGSSISASGSYLLKITQDEAQNRRGEISFTLTKISSSPQN